MTATIQNVNDASQAPPRLSCWLNEGNLGDLPAWSQAPTGSPADIAAAVKAAGFEGMQGYDTKACREAGLLTCSGGRIDTVHGAHKLVTSAQEAGHLCATVHVGGGNEDDDVIDRLVESVIEASTANAFPIYIETHRATITQDMWRTVQMVHRHPGIRFNGDFSHWYTGLEMPYGNFDAKLDFIQPVFDRVAFMHGRIGNSGSMQVPVTVSPALPESAGSYLDDFRVMWTRAMQGFIENAGPGDVLIFAPELLRSSINYARVFPDADGVMREEADRWLDALQMVEIAKECFAAAAAHVVTA